MAVRPRALELRDSAFRDLFAQADEAGRAAAAACKPTPLVVRYQGRTSIVDEGYCGTAWVSIHPGNSAIANYAKKQLGARRAFRGGVTMFVDDFGQSWERKCAFARAFAEVLSSAGFEAHAHDYVD